MIRALLLAAVGDALRAPAHGVSVRSHHRLRAAPAPAAPAATAEAAPESFLDAANAEAFAYRLRKATAVEGLKAIDAASGAGRADLLGAAPFCAVLERVAETRAPLAALGALVGHTVARSNAAGVGGTTEVMRALAPALLKARKNAEALAAVDALAKNAGPEDWRRGLVAATRLKDSARVKAFSEKLMRADGAVEAMDEDSLKFALKAASKAGDYRTAFGLVDALPAERRTTPLYHGAITACGRAKPRKGRTAMVLWRRMKDEGLTVPRSTYNALLHAAQGAELENATTALLTEMAAQNVSLNVVSYNIALNSLASNGRFSEVLDLLDAMETSSIAPTEVTFGTAINGAAMANNSAAAVALLEAQTKVGLALGDPAYASALEACVRDPDGPGGARRAARILDVIGADASVDLERRERVEALARAALHRGVIDGEGLKKKEEILNMVLHNRQGAV